MPLKKRSKYNYIVLLYKYYIEKTHARLNITPSKRSTTTNISDNDDNDTIVPAIYTTNDTIRAIQNWKISKVANKYIKKY